uniref:FYVE-type domain-containing protein n=1 Tax=Parascaris univalens TaxID=6257 RepID=A0A915CAP5_PARUN
MAAIINARPGSSTHSSMGDAKPVLLSKIEGQVARVNAVFLLTRDEGVITISDDRSVRIWLKRDNGQFWPSIHHFMPFAPTAMFFTEHTLKLLIGLANGAVYEFTVADDMNSMWENRHWNVHANTVTAVLLSVQAELIFSCSKDKSLVWHCSETSVKFGTHICESSCMALQFDSPSKFVFIGDAGGGITLLRLNGTEAQFVSKLSAHTGSIVSLAWDSSRQLLFSAATDHLVIMWDIGGKKGQAFELNAHNAKLSCVAYAEGSNRLFSADENGTLVCWDMTAKRLETPEWKSNDNCELCDAPFFWNIRAMWDRKVVGLRQHHCRTCGNAVCANCCGNTTKFPPMGYELPVRICNACHARMEQFPEQFDLTPLAVSSELRQGVVCMHMQETLGRLVTVGLDRIIMIWDVKQLVR